MKTVLYLLSLALLALPLGATAAEIAGKLNGLNCAITGYVCPIDKRDPMVALEPDFVVHQADGDYYLISNIDRAVKARYALEDVVVQGEVNEQYRTIQADSLQVKQNGQLKTVWTQEAQNKVREELMERLYGSPH
ncbi:MAG: hypothetical protein R3310_03855 [Candidatus Competibacteraceae bacterium]|nr:hypothetical protein [Candidatus Competibacteraceae bacterium]